jgi:predicted RNase H-like HicB family nuclease
MNITVIVYDGDYVATCEEYPSISGIGDTEEKAIEELKTVVEEIENEQ